jgi:hypothetical protein
MRRAIKVTLSGFGRENVELIFDEKPTVRQALEKAGWSLASAEKASVSGQAATMDDILESGDVLLVVGKKDGGR